MRLLNYLFKDSVAKLSAISAASIVSGIAGASLVAIIGKAVTGDGDASQLGFMFLGVCLLFVLTKSLSEVALLKLTQNKMIQLRLRLGHKLLSTSPKKLQEIGKDGLMVILTRDIDNFAIAFQVIPGVLSSVIVLTACMAYTAWISIEVFVIFVITMVICVGGYLVAERSPMKELSMAREKLGDLYRYLRGLVDGSRELQLNQHRSNAYINDNIGHHAKEFAGLYVNSMGRYTWTNNVGNILFYQSIAATLFIAPLFFDIPAEETIAATLVMLYVIRPISEILFAMPSIRQATVSLNKIKEIDDKLSNDTSIAKSHAFGKEFKSLALQEISFTYSNANDESFTVGPISLEIKPGEILFIVGGNGSGKTSLGMLILGLFQAEEGKIRFNSTEINKDNLLDYRQYFSAIFSDGYVFEELPEACSEDKAELARHYLKKFRLDHKVSISNGRFSTTALSTGQRKRLAMISTFIEDRPIYLFDEWAAEQDPEFKEIFYTEIIPEMKQLGKTIIVVTHDDAYFDRAEHTIKLQDGLISKQTVQASESKDTEKVW
ncbi:cyclic peptide export ABC transporter [Pseudoalteromonas sp. OOF1S-7]|uniref:cyclic peptide export ABC transporter n=1 Tax=Pseudoalteromonas sp. OOF1S-7 TaxID=2917757 RepID=UPI001EF61B42|nr:cyclic peptide export ABC transporter [Pseudoalteromonas sp. OOF1S-7]MCG7534483.1 cyclic peptide export ABC transporter [Pseudoalteromonas sp. OOF1S-7]